MCREDFIVKVQKYNLKIHLNSYRCISVWGASPVNLPWCLIVHVLLSPDWSTAKFLQKYKKSSKLKQTGESLCSLPPKWQRYPNCLILVLERKITHFFGIVFSTTVKIVTICMQNWHSTCTPRIIFNIKCICAFIPMFTGAPKVFPGTGNCFLKCLSISSIFSSPALF